MEQQGQSGRSEEPEEKRSRLEQEERAGAGAESSIPSRAETCSYRRRNLHELTPSLPACCLSEGTESWLVAKGRETRKGGGKECFA